MEFWKARSWKQLFFYFLNFLFFLILETLISRIEKLKKNGASDFFLVVETLILRIKKIKKTEPLIFLEFFLILEIIFGIREGQKLETIIFSFFHFIFF